MTNHIVIAYGSQKGYHHGAKYQIVRLISQFGLAGRSITVVTDRPELFNRYPVDVLHLDPVRKAKWGGEGTDHFGIKLKGFVWAASQYKSGINLLLDTDMYWTKDPKNLISRLQPSQVAMYRDEGQVLGSKNKSFQRFEVALVDREIAWSGGVYQLTHKSRMYGSAIIGLDYSQLDLLENAFDLFRTLSPRVAAHTVEQFSLSETLRMSGTSIVEGKTFTGDWSSTGKKNDATPVLSRFFEKEGEHEFHAHLDKWKSIAIKRPLHEIIKQKLGKLRANK
jgi:hypothetical protein